MIQQRVRAGSDIEIGALRTGTTDLQPADARRLNLLPREYLTGFHKLLLGFD
jgi:hypothetical protein